MPPDPLISVIMPVFNCDRYLAEAIESILVQTLADFELILINDGSTDRTGEIAQSYSDPRIRYIENDHNLGLVNTLNLGIKLARSEIVARMDGDDVSMPNRLMVQYRYFHEHPIVGVAGSNVEIIDESSRPVRTWKFPSDPALIRWTMIFTNPMAHPSVMMRKSLVQAVGGYRDYKAEDIDLWERLSQVTQLTNLPLMLLKLRKHSSNITREEREALISSAAEISLRMIQRLSDQIPPADLVMKMYGKRLEAPSDSLEVARLIENLYQLHVATPGLTTSTQVYIRRDAARRLLRLNTRDNIHLWQTWQLLRSACALDPLVPFRVLVSRVSTFLTQWQTQ